MSAEPESKRAIHAALFANVAIAATKLAAAYFSGSAAMAAEGVHSLVDTSNELLLLYGMKRAAARRSREHPLGHGRELYFWSFIVALLVFSLGAGVSIYEGIEHLRQPEPNRQHLVTYLVLAFSAIFDGYSFVIAIRQFNRIRGQLGFLDAIRLSKDPTTFAVVLEDGAALLGIGIAFLGVLSAQLLESPRLDGVASIGIGLVLAMTALLMARECKALLIGESADPRLEAAILRIVSADADVARANGVITLHLAPSEIVAAISAAFHNRLTATQIETCVARLETLIRAAYPQVTLLFVKPQNSQAFLRSHLAREIAESDREAAELEAAGAAEAQPASQKLT
jgi:cation diffusion facilitator family transporter